MAAHGAARAGAASLRPSAPQAPACSDCHRTGPVGDSAHKSSFVRRYETEAPGTGGVEYRAGADSPYALCDGCHDLAGSVLKDVTYKRHNMHVTGEGAACGTCHAVHGGRVRFDPAIVKALEGKPPVWERSGANSGRCYLTCHGQRHAGNSY